jgi:hypothetical protein
MDQRGRTRMIEPEKVSLDQTVCDSKDGQVPKILKRKANADTSTYAQFVDFGNCA